MKKLMYKVSKTPFLGGKTETVYKGRKKEATKIFNNLPSDGKYNLELSASWERNGKSLGTTLMAFK
jgi:hypothetical protein